ncbi:hypothetical protein C8R45DRAFT_1112287 [Mycena sanguinolenta]|nr:hypothetical protein C8R45DRAFT_1112287 [Mycena sanguinolenta]
MQLKLTVFFALALASLSGALTLERQATDWCLPPNYPCEIVAVTPPQITCCPGYRCLAASDTCNGIGLKLTVFFALAFATLSGALILERQVPVLCLPENYPCETVSVIPPPPGQPHCCELYTCVALGPDCLGIGRCRVPPPS